MGRWLTALGVAVAIVGPAATQQSGPAAGTAAMPGQIVGTGVNLNAAGTRIPAAAPRAGNPIGSPLTRPYDPAKPLDAFKGTNIDPRSIVAPVSGFPGTQQPDLLDKLYDKLGSVTKFFRPTSPTMQTPTVTPGIFRRNRERAANRMWRND